MLIWEGVIDFFRRHTIEGVENTSADAYQRNILVNGEIGHIRVTPIAGRNALQLQLHSPDSTQLMPIVATVRRMFDLDANPEVIANVLNRDPLMRPLLVDYPGIRLPVHGSVYESTIRAIVGQQVSIRHARQICSQLARASAEVRGQGDERRIFPEPADLARLAEKHFPMPERRRETLQAICLAYLEEDGQPNLKSLAGFRGIGPWTLAMVAMRGYGDPDIYPPGDLGLVRAHSALSGDKPFTKDGVEPWRPWRSYAANLLWRSLST